MDIRSSKNVLIKTRLNLVLLALILLLLSGCELNSTMHDYLIIDTVEIPTLIPTSTEKLSTSLNTVEPTVNTTVSPSLTSTFPPPTSTPEIGCVLPSEHDPLAETDFENYGNVILDFLNSGASVDELISLMQNYEIANQPNTVQASDITGDGRMDVVVSIRNPYTETVTSPGNLFIYICQEEQYALEHNIESGDEFNAPSILQIQDLNSDGLNELIYSKSNCGAHSCFENVSILMWNGMGFEEKLEGQMDDLPFPDIQLTDYDQDGIYNLEVVGSGFGSVGAGPQRDRIRIWEYNQSSGFWVAGADAYGPSNYRIHILHDADAAARRGEYQVASLLYNMVINDQDLLNWLDKENEQLNLAAYSRYKLVVVYMLQEDREQAGQMLQAMKSIYYVGLSQFAYLEMAEAFLRGYEAGGGEVGCAEAQLYATLHREEVLTPLGPSYFGYANPDYTVLDICP
jgi:hypothetical protein